MVPVFSIVFALGMPVFALFKPAKRPYIYSCISFLFCACGLIAEIITIRQRLFAGDIGGIEDTVGGVILICVILVILTTILNLILLGMSYEKE